MTADSDTDPTMTVGIPTELKASVQQELSQRDRELAAFVIACLNDLESDPDDFLEFLAPHWPEQKRPGRPPIHPAAGPDACRTCSGTGIAQVGIGAGSMDCGVCSGSGLAKEPKFRVTCECGTQQPRATTAFSANRWMKKHLHTHRPLPKAK